MSRNRRSILFMPGDSFRKIQKARQLDVDSIVMDLEDGVALSQKEEARKVVVQAFQELDFGPRERLIRINPPRTSYAQKDLQSTIHVKPDGYVIPKVESPEDLQQVSDFLTKAEQENGWLIGSIRLLALIETAKGILHLPQIVQASSRLEALMFGAEDLAGDIGAQRTPEGWEVFYARSAVVTAAAAYQIDAIDTVFIDLKDLDALQKECIMAKKMGYTGKMAIHPRQVEVFNRTFAPSEKEVNDAKSLLAAYDENQKRGTGAFSFQGKMIDTPMIRGAQKVLQRAK